VVIGEHEPFISEEHVQAALETLVYTSSPRSIPAALQHLILVDEFLINPEFPPSARSREFAFQHILIKMIHSELSRHRLALGLSEPLENESLETTIAAISQDAQNGSKELIGWDLLYYRYVRVDLDIDSGLISDLTYIDERTLRRYRTHAIRRLTERLVKAEWEARSRLKKRRLYAQLPAASVDGALGREAILQRAFNALCEDLPIRICVSGPPGIGKSTFVQELLRRYIDKYDLDELVWINYPPSPTFVRHYLSEQLLPPTSSITLREYLLSYRVAVVLDEIESLLADNQALDELLDYLSPALICLTGHEHIMSSRVTLQIQLGELDYTASRDVVLSAMSIGDEAPDPETSDSLTTLLYDKVGGNPTALKLAARNFSIYDPIIRSCFCQSG
jgi:hypothetical protein